MDYQDYIEMRQEILNVQYSAALEKSVDAARLNLKAFIAGIAVGLGGAIVAPSLGQLALASGFSLVAIGAANHRLAARSAKSAEVAREKFKATHKLG